MKRDLNLIRGIVLEVEAVSDGKAKVYEFSSDQRILRNHLDLMIEHGLLRRVGSIATMQRYKVELTWEGHDFVDAVRDRSNWEMVKDVAEDAGGWTFETLRDAAKSIIAQKLAGSLAAYAGIT